MKTSSLKSMVWIVLRNKVTPSTKPYIYPTMKFIPSFLHFFSSYHSSSLPFFLLLLSTLLFAASVLSFPVLSYSFLFSYFCLFFPLLSFLSSHVLSYSFVSSLNSPKFQFDSLSYQSKQSSQPPKIDRATSRGSGTVVEKSLRNINPITCS